MFEYPLSSVIDQSYFVLFARANGYDVTPTEAERAILEQIKAQILQDYVTVLGRKPGPPASNDTDAIEAALIRQPQLYRFYRDREFWSPHLNKALDSQFKLLGFP